MAKPKQSKGGPNKANIDKADTSGHPGKGGWKQADTDKTDTNDSQDQDAAVYIYGGNAIALGQDTLTSVETTGKISDNGPVTIARITIEAMAAAEGDFTYASADTWVDSNADISRLKIVNGSYEADGISYDYSYAVYKGVHLPVHVNLPGAAKNKVIVVEVEGDPELEFDVDGNTATVTFDVEVLGENTYAGVETFALAVEDALSNSVLQIEAAVG